MHEYSALTRRLPLVVILVWMIAGIGLYLSVVLRAPEFPPLRSQLYFWAPWAIAIALGLWGQLSYNKRLRSIEPTDEGLWVGERGSDSARLIAWSQIDRVVRLKGSSSSPGIVPSRAGLYVWATDRPLVIFEQISEFDTLANRLRDELVRRGIPFEG
jgi:hypothetical protein